MLGWSGELRHSPLLPTSAAQVRHPDPRGQCVEHPPRKGHARPTGPRAGHTTPPFPALRRGLAHRNCPSLPSTQGLPTHPPSPPEQGLGNRSPQVHQEVRSLAQGENQTWKHDVEKHCFIFPFPKTSSAGLQGPSQHACLQLGPMCSGLRVLVCQPELT